MVIHQNLSVKHGYPPEFGNFIVLVIFAVCTHNIEALIYRCGILFETMLFVYVLV